METGWLGMDGGMMAWLASDWTGGAAAMAVLFVAFGLRARLAGDEATGGCGGSECGTCGGECGSCGVAAPGESTNNDCRTEVTP